MHPLAERRARQYLDLLDRLAPGRVVGLYVVGSAALDAFHPDRSDVDLVAVLDHRDSDDCQLVRTVHRRSAIRSFPAAIARGRPSVPGVCNTVFVAADDLRQPVRAIQPIGSHVGLACHCGSGFDVNPVMWRVLRDHGVAVRGAAPSSLGVDPEGDVLRQWNLDNLHAYWEPLARTHVAGRPAPRHRFRPRWTTSWLVLGPTRLYRTIATGEIITKEQAGEHALEVFDSQWHPIIREGLAARRGDRRTGRFDGGAAMMREAGRFGLHVVERADALG
ncbi:aminoglycoside adenylyltransferase domain-containing protein [Actinospongicola halichondriae]|uniref:aminoglycoside adenylyltransferase domain-containing protein n=1 Tax=Actinospongicola halichondriae TaxID=3236844 RepID=UPI003D3AD8E4